MDQMFKIAIITFSLRLFTCSLTAGGTIHTDAAAGMKHKDRLEKQVKAFSLIWNTRLQNMWFRALSGIISNLSQSLTDFYKSIFLLALFHVGEVDLPTSQSFALLTVLLPAEKLSYTDNTSTNCLLPLMTFQNIVEPVFQGIAPAGVLQMTGKSSDHVTRSRGDCSYLVVVTYWEMLHCYKLSGCNIVVTRDMWSPMRETVTATDWCCWRHRVCVCCPVGVFTAIFWVQHSHDDSQRRDTRFTQTLDIHVFVCQDKCSSVSTLTIPDLHKIF